MTTLTTEEKLARLLEYVKNYANMPLPAEPLEWGAPESEEEVTYDYDDVERHGYELAQQEIQLEAASLLAEIGEAA